MKLTDDMLRQAAPAVRQAMLDSLPAPDECRHLFSPVFERRMRPLLRRARHPALYRVVRQAAACLLTLLLLGGGWLAADTDARAAFLQWVREVYETQIIYRFAGLPAERSGVYRSGWIPEGYTEFDVWDGGAVYVSGDDRILAFEYGPMQEGSAVFVQNADKSIIKQVEVNGIPGELYLSTDPTLSNGILWIDADAGVCFTISGFLSEADILHMAKSVYWEDPTN